MSSKKNGKKPKQVVKEHRNDYHIYLDDELARLLDSLAEEEDCTVTRMVRVLVKEALAARTRKTEGKP